MKIFQRAILLGLFVAVGVGIALGLGFSTEATKDAAGKKLCANRPLQKAVSGRLPDGAERRRPENSGCQAAGGARIIESDSMTSAVIALPNPPFAGQATPPATAPSTTSPLKVGNITLPLGADSILQQAAALLDQAANKSNNPSPQANRQAKQTDTAAEQIPAGSVVPSGSAALPGTAAEDQRVPRGQIEGLKVIGSGGNERLSINIQNANIREVLDLISQQGNLNILTSSQVQGTVSATLSGVDLNSALDAILKSAGLAARREGSFIFVGNNSDFESMERAMDRVSTRVYRPNYVQAAELETLIKPVLTQGSPGVGTVSVTTPSEIGIEADSTKAGGDTYAGSDAVVVRDYEAILAEIDQLVLEIDVRPAQVQIEAMILSVELSDDFEFGVSFEVLRQFPHLRFGWGTPQSTLNDFKYDGGLNVAFLDESLGAFVKALESVGDTDVIGTPRLLVVNKHRAEIQVGESRGYVSTTQTETARTQSVEFLELGTILRIRPFISSDGLIRMEVHPEISDGTVEVKEGFTLPNKQTTQVTTNVMVRDGCTVVIGGLIKEELKNTRSQIPLLGSLPVVGVAFRTKKEVMKRRELIVLLTPHIVGEPDMCREGNEAASEFHRRQQVVLEKTSPIGKSSLGRRYTRKAQQAWAMGDRDRAMRLAEMAVNFDPQNRAAIDLRSNIWMGRRVGKHTLPPEPGGHWEQNPLDGRQVAPWILDDLSGQAAQSGQPGTTAQPLAPMPMEAAPCNDVPGGGAPQFPIDPGQPGRRVNINRPEKLEPFESNGSQGGDEPRR